MKTKDFIEMLKKADPSGEAYVRLPYGGAPIFAERKEGYWDGAYQYYDKETGTLVTTTLGSKVDIHVIDYCDIAWEENGDMEKIRKRVKLDHSNFCGDIPNEKNDRIWKAIEGYAEWAREHDKQFMEKWYKDVVEEFFTEDIIEVRQPLDKPIGYYNCMTAHLIDGSGTPTKFNQGQCEILIRSGKFYPEKQDEYYVWKHDPDKGKDWTIQKES